MTKINIKSKEDFVTFVQTASKRKKEYLEVRKRGVSQQEMNALGFKTVTFS